MFFSFPSNCKFEETRGWLEAHNFGKTFPTSEFKIEGYKMYRKDRTKEDGGILIYDQRYCICYKEAAIVQITPSSFTRHT